MRKITVIISSVLCVVLLSLGLVSCKPKPKPEPKPDNKETAGVLNGGFESADLSGWTIEYGDAFDDDCISSQQTFMFENDANNNVLAINQTGNWYLTGKGYHGKYSGARTGALRSSNFVLSDDGAVSLKLAGGALTIGKGTGAPQKAKERICYVGFYLAENDKMIAMQTNQYFHEHTEEYIIPERYAAEIAAIFSLFFITSAKRSGISTVFPVCTRIRSPFTAIKRSVSFL